MKSFFTGIKSSPFKALQLYRNRCAVDSQGYTMHIIPGTHRIWSNLPTGMGLQGRPDLWWIKELYSWRARLSKIDPCPDQLTITTGALLWLFTGTVHRN